MVTIITTRADVWWRAQQKWIRILRGLAEKDVQQSTEIIMEAIRSGRIGQDVADIYRKVVGWGWTPEDVYDDPAVIDAMPRAADLTIALPFTPTRPNHRGGDQPTQIGDAWYEMDASPVGSIDTTGTYEKFVVNSGAGVNWIFYGDWTADFGARTLNCWVRVK